MSNVLFGKSHNSSDLLHQLKKTKLNMILFDAGKRIIALLKSVTGYSIIPLCCVRRELLVLN